MLENVLTQIDATQDAALQRLKEFIAIPSISTDPAYAAPCREAAKWLAADLTELGFEVQIMDTPGHPMVVARHTAPGPHMLFYGHYDVQPVDPLDLWNTDPFEATIVEGDLGPALRGRGTSDDKGQLMTFVEACRAWKAVHGTLPANLTLLFEGEEETGSPSLVPFLEENKDLLKADVALICDTGLLGNDTPAIVTRLRGLLGEEITLKGPDIDLHSGMYGGPAVNPIRILTRVLASLHDDTGRVTVPGFYDGVADLPTDIAQSWGNLDFDPAAFLGGVGLLDPAGEAGRSVLEMIWSRPTCEVNGIWGGYTGAGFKTVLPSTAHAKVSFRLVGKQDPIAIRKAFRAQVESMLPPDVSGEFEGHGASPASEMATDHPVFQAAQKALSDEWPRPAAFVGCGGSIPIAGHFQDILGMDSMLVGFGRDNDAIHSPNEKYDLRSFHKGTRSWARILAELAT
ncbi:MAG: M20/M25/M40 family metallo-hydrolase [Planktomarina sp.]